MRECYLGQEIVQQMEEIEHHCIVEEDKTWNGYMFDKLRIIVFAMKVVLVH